MKAGAFGSDATLVRGARCSAILAAMQSRSMTPIVAITMGDAAGIGEIIVKALAGPEVYARIARPLVIGDRARLARAESRAFPSALRR